VRQPTPPSRGFAYFLDLDGTLVEFAAHPAGIRLQPSVPRLVRALSQESGGALAIVTGRPIADVDRLFPGLRLPVAGHHGLVRRRAEGTIERHAFPRGELDPARRRLSAVAARHPGLVFEDKGISVALHYRRAPRLAGFVGRVMRDVHAALGPRYRLQRGKRVVELAPAGRGKGSAIAAFMREPPFRRRTPFFIGDDVTDEHGFSTVNRLGGYAVKVGPGRTAARWRFHDVSAVLHWLEHGTPAPRRVRRRTR
jgi:trehalose 6-phosphate phosphatase